MLREIAESVSMDILSPHAERLELASLLAVRGRASSGGMCFLISFCINARFQLGDGARLKPLDLLSTIFFVRKAILLILRVRPLHSR